MELLTIEDVAKFFSVSENTVKCWITRRKIPDGIIFKIGKRKGTVRFIKSRLEEWVANGSLQT